MTDTLKSKLRHVGMIVPAGSSEAFEAWRCAVAPMYKLDSLAGGGHADHATDAESYSLGAAKIGISTSSASQFQRSRSVLGRSPLDSLNVILYTHGSYQMTFEGHDVVVSAGDIVLHDMAREMTIKAEDFANFSLIFPRHMLEPLLPNLDSLHGFVLRRGTPLHAILYSHLIELRAQLPHLTQDQAPMIAEVTAALVATCIGQSRQDRVGASSGVSLVALSRIRRVIDANLSNPHLGPDFLTQKCGISRASLYRQFEALGGVAKFIQERRLARVYQDLANPSLAHERINTVSERWGFTNAAVLTRAFRRQYDIKPSELRSHAAKPKAPDPHDGHHGLPLFQQWLTTGALD